MNDKELIHHIAYGFWKIEKQEGTLEENYEVMKSFLDLYDPNWFKNVDDYMKDQPPRIIELE
jgi:hypothetical protein